MIGIARVLRWLFGARPVRTQFGRIPYWCMDPKHQPYYREATYDAHMFTEHGVDVTRAYQTKVKT